MEWEKEGAESWALPDYGPPRFNIYNPTAFTEESETDTATAVKSSVDTDEDHDTVPDPANPPSNIKTHQPTEKEKLPAQDRPDESRKHRKSGRSNRQATPPTKDTYARSKWRKGSVPDASLRLPCAYTLFQIKIAQTPSLSSEDSLCRRLVQETGVYAKVSNASADIIQVWGKPRNVLSARRMVRRFVEAAMPDATMPDSDEEEKKLGWKRISAHSNIKSVTDKLKEVNDAKLERLRHAPETRTDCKYIFLWPPHGEPSLKDGLDLRRQWLDEIRAAYDVYIYTESGNKNCLYLSANSEANLCNVSNELRAMRQALSVRAEGGIKLFLVEPPTPSLMKTEIRVEETDGFAKPFLHGNKLPQEQALAWSSRAQAFKQDNKDVIQGHLGRALVSVPPSNGVLQMRAKFGTFTLDEWTKPATGDTYQFKEFRDILRRDSVAGRLLPGICLSENELFKRIREAKDLLVPWGDVKLDSLLKIAPRHSASFDFQAGTDGIIRVEVNFLLLEGTSEFEVSGSRCFKPRKPCKPKDSKEAKDSKGPIKPMQIGMIDFERADWELEIKALELHPAKQHSAELRKFKHSIRYVWNPSSSSIGSMPQRKAKFHPSAPITRFVEKSAIQLSVIGTAYTFELARFDDYLYANHRWAKSPKVSWGASLFNPEWDELLTTQAHGGTIYDTSCLSSFFQASPETVAKAMEGMSDDEAEEKYEEIQTRLDLEELRTFMSKVQTLARMLGSSDFEAVEVLNADLGTLF